MELRSINDMSLQEIYDFVKEAINKQGKPSKFDGICLYRGPDGLKCAAGHLIPDACYHKSFEGKMVGHDLLNKALSNPTSEKIMFISYLQRCHDKAVIDNDGSPNPFFIIDFNTRMCEVAEEYNLIP